MTPVAGGPARPVQEQLAVRGPGPRVVVLGLLGAALVAGAVGAISPPAAVGAAVAALVISTARHRPVTPAVVVVGLCPALSGVARGLGVGPFKLSEALLLLAAGLVLLRRPQPEDRLRAPDVGLLAYAGLAAAFAALHVLSGASAASSFFRVGLAPLLLVLTWWTASRSVRGAEDLAHVVRWLLLVSIVPSALAVGQGFDVPGLRSLLIALTGGPSLAGPGEAGVARVTGPFPSWHSFAAYLVVPLLVAVVLLLRREQDVLPRPALVAVLTVDVAALVLTVTATVVVWVVVAVLVLGWRRRRLAQAGAVLAAAALVGGLAFAGPIASRVAEQQVQTTLTEGEQTGGVLPQTVSYRLLVWKRDYLPLIEQSVPRGVSNELPESVLFAHSENAYITVVLRGGILLVGAATLAMVLLGRRLAGIDRREGLVAAVADSQWSVLVFLPVAIMIWPYFTNAGFPQTFFATAGAVLGAAGFRAADD